MSDNLRTLRDRLITHRFAIIVISIFLGASAFGWIVTEFVPPNVPARRDMYRELWGDAAVKAIEFFRLYDPFHSIWYRSVIVLFFVVILLCTLTRWKSFIMRSFRIHPPKGSQDLEKKEPRISLSLNDLKREGDTAQGSTGLRGEHNRREEPAAGGLVSDVFHKVSEVFRRRGYHIVSDSKDNEFLFTAVAGRWRFFGEFLFHLGLVVVTAGGIIGSYWGSTEILYGRSGDVLPLHDSEYSIVVEDFEMLKTARNELLNYRSIVTLLDGRGDTLRVANVEVNRPLKFGGFNVYQSSYHAAEREFKSASVEYGPEGAFHDKKKVILKPNEKVLLEGTSFTVEAKRFFPDFKMNAEGPYSASRNMDNPALEVEVVGEEASESGWLFLLYPRFNSLSNIPVSLKLVDVEPMYYTGLQISTSPGSPTVLVGIILATAGLILLYMFGYRSIKGLVGRERILIAGTGCSWKVSFLSEFKTLEKALRKEITAIIGARGRG